MKNLRRIRARVKGNPPRNPLLEAALRYAELGWYVVPVKGKKPWMKDWQHRASNDPEKIKSWWREWPNANIAILAGKSGLFVLDVDGEVGQDSLNELRGDRRPKTVRALTGGGGEHFLFKRPKDGLRNRTGVMPGLDIKCDGGLFVAPPSLHKSGKLYRWKKGRSPFDLNPAKVPGWLLKLIEAQARPPQCGDKVIPFHQRNTRFASIGGSLRRRGASESAIDACLQVVNKEQCEHPLEESEVQGIAKSLSKYDPGSQEFAPSDLGNAERLTFHHGADLRFCKELGWVVWDGKRWGQDKTDEVYRRAKETVRSIYHEAGQETLDENKRKDLARFAMKCEQRNRIVNMVDLAQKEADVIVRPEEFDTDPYLLNCENGTIDLRSGELKAHDPMHLITKLVPVEFDPDAKCPRWKRFLREILGGDRKLIRFIQKSLGYSLTGDTCEQCWFFLHGTGANGKSTLINTILHVMGDYALQASPDTFLATKGGGPRNDLARFLGARLIAAGEPDNSKRLDDGLIKRFTGQDPITCRFLYREEFTYQPAGKLFFSANHKPRVDDASPGFWRRLHSIPFNVAIFEAEQDKTLIEKLKKDAPGILAWLVRGCLAWQRKALKPPQEVAEATKEYQIDSDPLAAFFEDSDLCFGEGYRIEKRELYDLYVEWFEEKCGERRKPVSSMLFSRMLSGRFTSKRVGRSKIRHWVGIGKRIEKRATLRRVS
jgi:putative DNA primase/helicase